MIADEEKMKDRFFCPIITVGAYGGGQAMNAVEMFVQGYVLCTQLPDDRCFLAV